jgi:eukaryotic-like serine/threonine-protein kinase
MDASGPTLPSRIGRYRVERLLGRGAMGRVLLARDPVLDRDVAVKLLRDDLGLLPEQQESLVDRMRHEAKACARVTHPHIVGLFDMGEDPGLGLYLVFEYVEGTNLKDRLAQGPLPPSLTARVAREIGGALSTAHVNGVLHRDVKPENIILTEHGSKIADFGIARVPNSTLTKNGGLLGTPAYSAPECIVDGEFSAASDQFSLAATLYEALSRKRAFPGEDAVAVATRITNEEPPGIADACGFDRHVDEVLARALSKAPERRFPTAGEFGDALAEALGHGSRAALPTLPDAHHRRQPQPSNGTRTAIGGGAVGVLLGVAAMRLTSGLGEAAHEPAPTPLPRVVRPVAWLAPAAEERPRPSSHPSARRAPSAVASVEPAPAVPAPSASAPRPPVLDGGKASDGATEP